VKYVSLHHHTTYSYMDGYGTPAQHIEVAAEYGMGALAITDHGNTSGHVAFEKAAVRAGVKPIFGLEAYTAISRENTRKMHLTILAADAEGYASLNRIVGQSFEDFHQWPTVYGSTLAEYSEGLIVLSGCSDSLLACLTLGGKQIPEEEANRDRAAEYVERMKELFGDRFYLECQMFPEFERARKLNEFYEELGKRYGIPLVATADVHTLREGQSEIRALLHAAGRGNNTIAKQLSSWEYEVPDYIPPSDEWVRKRLRGAGLSKRGAAEAFASTGEIAERCSVTLPKAERFRYPATEEAKVWQ
jgi:DNA polymerase III subunit alpha